MSESRGTHAPVRLLVGLTAAALLVLAGCSSSSTESSSSSTAPSTTAATGADGTTPGTAAPDTPGTSAVVEEIDNDDVIAGLEADHPELLPLVDTTYLSWSAFGGFTIPVPAGTDTATAIELCEAVSETVYQGGDDSITIATDVSASNLMGTPIVERTGEAGTCAAV